MYIHYFLKKVFEDGNTEEANEGQGILGSIKTYVITYSSKPFYYNIGGSNFTLDEIKHGLLRNNQKSPFNYMRSLGQNDEKTSLLTDFYDPRVNFICLDYPECLEFIDSFEGTDEDKLDDELETFVSNIIEAQVNIDLEQNEI